jgi:hypothetical protein
MITFADTYDAGRRPPWTLDGDAGYVGNASITVKGIEIPVRVELQGCGDSTDGVGGWIGRVASNDRLAAIVGDLRRIRAIISTPHGQREAYVGDPDFWGRFRIQGMSSQPPFAID